MPPFGVQPAVSYAGAGSAPGGVVATSGGTDWGAVIGGVIGAGMSIWDAHTYTDQERSRDQLALEQAKAAQAAAAAQAQASAQKQSDLLSSPVVLIAGGGVLLLGVVLLARK